MIRKTPGAGIPTCPVGCRLCPFRRQPAPAPLTFHRQPAALNPSYRHPQPVIPTPYPSFRRKPESNLRPKPARRPNHPNEPPPAAACTSDAYPAAPAIHCPQNRQIAQNPRKLPQIRAKTRLTGGTNAPIIASNRVQPPSVTYPINDSRRHAHQPFRSATDPIPSVPTRDPRPPPSASKSQTARIRTVVVLF